MREHKGQFLCPMHGTSLSAYKERMFGDKDFTCSKCGDTYFIPAKISPICPHCFSNVIVISKPRDKLLICSNQNCPSHYFEKEVIFYDEDIKLTEAITEYYLYSGINYKTLLFSLEVLTEENKIQDNWQYKGKFITELIITIVRNYFSKVRSVELIKAMEKHPFPLLNGIINERSK